MATLPHWTALARHRCHSLNTQNGGGAPTIFLRQSNKKKKRPDVNRKVSRGCWQWAKGHLAALSAPPLMARLPFMQEEQGWHKEDRWEQSRLSPWHCPWPATGIDFIGFSWVLFRGGKCRIHSQPHILSCPYTLWHLEMFYLLSHIFLLESLLLLICRCFSLLLQLFSFYHLFSSPCFPILFSIFHPSLSTSSTFFLLPTYAFKCLAPSWQVPGLFCFCCVGAWMVAQRSW